MLSVPEDVGLNHAGDAGSNLCNIKINFLGHEGAHAHIKKAIKYDLSCIQIYGVQCIVAMHGSAKWAVVNKTKLHNH